MISTPRNPLAAHIGNGVVQVYAETPLTGVLDHYEVQVAKSQAGPYTNFSNRFFWTNDGFIFGFVPGTTIYLQIRAIGADKSVSDWVQVQGATATTPQARLTCSAVKGSFIPAGSIFTMPKAKQRIFGFRSLADIQF